MPGEQLLLINPRRRKRAKNVRRRRVHRAHRRSRRANPVRHHRRHRRHVARRYANPRRRIHRGRRRRRNPFSTTGMVNDYLMPGALGAVGGVALGYVWGLVSPMLSCAIGTNTTLQVAAQSVGAIGLGMIAGKALGPTKGAAVGVGALTVVLYNYLNSMVATGGTGLAGLGARMRRGRRMGAYMPGTAIPRLGAYQPGTMGLAPGGGMHGMGYSPMNPAPYVQDSGSMDASGMF